MEDNELTIEEIQHKIKESLLTTLSMDEHKRIISRLYELSMGDDKRIALNAIDLLYNRLLGRPAETTQLQIQGLSPQVQLPELSREQLEQMYQEIEQQPEKFDLIQTSKNTFEFKTPELIATKELRKNRRIKKTD